MKKWVVVPLVVAGLLVNSTVPIHAIASNHIIVQMETEDVIVVYKNENGKQKIVEHATNIKRELLTMDAIFISLTEDKLSFLANDPDIALVQKSVPIAKASTSPPLPQWNVEMTNAHKAWVGNPAITGQGIKVAVIDTGVANHPELPNVVQRISFLENNPNTLINEANPLDYDGHGTHVAGIIGAMRGGGTVNQRDVVGVAPNVNLYSLKVSCKETSGTVLNIITAIDWAIANNMDIINISLGTTGNDVTLLREAVNRAYNAGILVVGASGNTHSAPVDFPARYGSVIAVSAIDREKRLATFASTGPEIEFTAPGVAVVSPHLNNYLALNGTSMAAPHVAGFLALLKQKNPQMSAQQLRIELTRYAEDLGEIGRDPKFGHGLINYEPQGERAVTDISELRIVEKSARSISIAWKNPNHEFFAKAVIYNNGVKVGETTEESFILSSLRPSTTHNIVVKTLDNRGEKSLGMTLSAQTFTAEVSNLQVVNMSESSATISYSLPADEDFEKVHIYVDGVFYKETIETTAVIAGLTPDTHYIIEVRTVDKEGNESLGINVEARTVALPIEELPEQEQNNEGILEEDDDLIEDETPEVDREGTVPEGPQPTITSAEIIGFQSTNITSNSLTVSWTNPDADFENVNFYVNGQLVGTVNRLDEPTFTMNDLPSNTTFTIVAKTVDSFGNESEGISIDVTTAYLSQEESNPPHHEERTEENPIGRVEEDENQDNAGVTEPIDPNDPEREEENDNHLEEDLEQEGGPSTGGEELEEPVLDVGISVPPPVAVGPPPAAGFAPGGGAPAPMPSQPIVQQPVVAPLPQIPVNDVPKQEMLEKEGITKPASPSLPVLPVLKDVEDGKFYSTPVRELVARGVITGYEDGTFRPANSISRAEFAHILVKALNLDTTNVTNPQFKDIPNTDIWYFQSIAALKEKGIVDGYGDNTFRPNAPITRAEVAKLLVLAYDLELQDHTSHNFTDLSQGKWYETYVLTLVEHEVAKGTTASTFSPQGETTRGQTATFIFRLLK